MRDFDELNQLMSGAHERRDGALLDVLKTLAASPNTHAPQPTPALAAFLQHPSPPPTSISARHQPAARARRLLRLRLGRPIRFVPAVLAGWLTPLLLGAATAVAATAGTAALIGHRPQPTVPAPASPSVTSHPTLSRAPTPARLLPTGLSATATSTPPPTGVPTLSPTTHAGSPLTRITPSRAATRGSPRSESPTSHTAEPTSHHGDDGAGTDQGDDQAEPNDQDTEAPHASHHHDSDSHETHENRDAERKDGGSDTTIAKPDQTGDHDD
jgi:hypothetical protein